MEIRLIGFDLDGTFLDDRKEIPPENLAALEAAAAKGVLAVPATGRVYAGIPEPLRRLPFLRWYILSNGAQIYDAAEDRTVARAEIPAERAAEFFRFADGFGLLYDCYRNGWGYMSAPMLERVPAIIPDPGIRRLIRELRSGVPELKDFLLEKGGGVEKLQLYFEDAALRRELLGLLPRRFPELRFSSSLPFNIEVNSADASKGQALRTLCGMLSIPTEQTLGIGDGTNDLDLITTAGVGTAMANAAPELLAAADAVTGGNNEGGFAAAVERFVLKGGAR